MKNTNMQTDELKTRSSEPIEGELTLEQVMDLSGGSRPHSY